MRTIDEPVSEHEKQIAYFIYIFEYKVDFLFATIGLFEVNNKLT